MICFLGWGVPMPLAYLSAPYPPSPLPRWGRGDLRLFYARGSAPCIPAPEPARHRFALPLWKTQCGLAPGGTGSTCPGGLRLACPRRHWLDLPRGRGPSQTPKFLSPGPPSPWLPALPIEKQFYRFRGEPRAPLCAGHLLGRLRKCRKRFNARGAGGGAPGEIK